MKTPNIKFILLLCFVVWFGLNALVFSVTGYADEAYDAYIRKDYTTAIRLARTRAEHGDSYAQYLLGHAYENGDGVDKNLTKARYWYKKAAEQGEASAQSRLGFQLDKGRGGKEDDVAAEFWYRKAAEQGDIDAQVHLAYFYYHGGVGVNTDYEKARYWTFKAAEQGDSRAQTNLGEWYKDGKYGLEKNITKALSWYQKAADQGDNWAFYQLGRMYESGDGVERDIKRAIYYFYKSSLISEESSSYDMSTDNLQGALAKEGYFNGTEDGKFGPITKAAAERYLKAKLGANWETYYATGAPKFQKKNDLLGLFKKYDQNFELPPELLAGDNQKSGNNTNASQRDILTSRFITKTPTFVTGEYYALLIAVKDYDSDEINDLDYPILDARKLRAVLTHYNFKNKNIILLQDPTRDEILNVLAKLRNSLSEHDNLLIFYAGHGYWDKRIEQGYWLPRDASRNSRSRWLSNSDIRDNIKGIKTNNTLLISDACFSGGIFKTRSAFKEATKAIKDLYRIPSRKAITSGILNEVPDRSVFLEYLIKRLEQNKQPYLSALDLFSSFRTAVINNSQNVPQYGDIANAGDEGGDFVFVRSGD